MSQKIQVFIITLITFFIIIFIFNFNAAYFKTLIGLEDNESYYENQNERDRSFETFIQTAEARCRSACRAFRKAVSIWSGFLSKLVGDASGTGSGLGLSQPFGGRVIVPLQCHCNPQHTALIINPVFGPSGPYLVQTLPPNLSLKKQYALFPGNWVLGTANRIPGACLLVPPFCFKFETKYMVTFTPGIGTSLTP